MSRSINPISHFTKLMNQDTTNTNSDPISIITTSKENEKKIRAIFRMCENYSKSHTNNGWLKYGTYKDNNNIHEFTVNKNHSGNLVLEHIIKTIETIKETICPKCGSNHNVKNGKRNNKQRYICKNCGYNFVM